MCGSRHIHTPITEGTGNSEGEGDQRLGNSKGERGCMIDLVSTGPLIQYGFKHQSGCSKILSYLLSRTFT